MAMYAARLETLQGVAPQRLVVVTGDKAEHPWRLVDVAPYARRRKQALRAAIDDRRGHRVGARQPVLAVPLAGPLRAGVGRQRRPRAGRRSAARPARGAAGSRHHDAGRARRRQPRGGPRGRGERDGEPPPPAGAAPAGRAHDRSARLRAAAARARPRPAAPARAEPRRRLPRLRGRPVGRRRAGPGVPRRSVGPLRHVHRLLGAHRRRGGAAHRGPGRRADAALGGRPGHARLPLRRLRAERPGAAHRTARDEGERVRPAAARRPARRPLRRGAPGHPHQQAVLLDQEARGLLLGAHARRQGPRPRWPTR